MVASGFPGEVKQRHIGLIWKKLHLI